MTDFLLFILIGFLAQLVDGAIGMAYGLISTSVLLSLGITPAVASASVHSAEMFTTAMSGYSHWRLGNVDKKLVLSLAPAGMLGGALGAYLISVEGDGILRLVISAYLFCMGFVVIWKGYHRKSEEHNLPKRLPLLGLLGGFFDAAGGGGWGPFVTTTLLGRGAHPRLTIGSVSLSEFFVTLTVSATFVATIGLELWPIIAGLIVGGVVAAPIAARAVNRLPLKAMMLAVGIVIVLLSARNVLLSLEHLMT